MFRSRMARKKREYISVSEFFTSSMYTVFFSDGPLRNFEDVKNSDTEMYSRFFRAMRERNIFVAPSAFEVAMVSFAHTEEDFAKTLDAVRGIKL